MVSGTTGTVAMRGRNFEKARLKSLPRDDARPFGAYRDSLPSDRLFKIKRPKGALPTKKAELRKIADQIASKLAPKKGQ
jgi:hypothetical protein